MSRLRRAAQLLLHVEQSPHRTALAFGIGVFIAFFPILGTHTILVLAIAFFFRLSRVAIFLGAFINNPWTLVPLFMTGTLFGCLLLGIPTEGLDDIDWGLKGKAFFSALFQTLRPFLWPFLVGNTLLGVMSGLVAYVILRRILERRRAVAQPQGSAT